MILQTETFKPICNTLGQAVDKSAALIELSVSNKALRLAVTNNEYYCMLSYPVEDDTPFNATVDAVLFLNLVAGVTAETFELNVKNNTLVLKAGKSNYKLPMVYENDKLLTLPVISIANKSVEMTIANDILQSILNVNSKEIAKLKGVDPARVAELQKLYYIDETGCFTFTNGACLNSFALEKPVKMLLNERIVRLFKLFKDDVYFSLGHDPLPNGSMQTKVTFETQNIYLAAIITNDDVLLNKIQGPCLATKRYIEEVYPIKIVMYSNTLSAAISRFMLFTKNSAEGSNMLNMPVTVRISGSDFAISDASENTEVVPIENNPLIAVPYEMKVNLADIKSVLDSCKDEHLTFNCGNRKSIIITRNNICNLIPEGNQ